MSEGLSIETDNYMADRMVREEAYFQKKRGRPPGSKNKPKDPVKPPESPPVVILPPASPEPTSPETVIAPIAVDEASEVGMIGTVVPILISPVPDETIEEPTNGPGPLTNPTPSSADPGTPNFTLNWRAFG